MAETTGTLARKLHAVMQALGAIEKRGQNKSQGYDYMMAEDVLAEVRQEFIKQGLVLLPACTGQGVVEGQTRNGGTNYLTSADMEYTIMDVETGEKVTLPWKGLGQDSGEKGLYKAYTGAIKYFLRNLLLIPQGDDPESDGTAPKPRHVQGRPAVSKPTGEMKTGSQNQGGCTDKQLDLIFSERKRRDDAWNKAIFPAITAKGFDLEPLRGKSSSEVEAIIRPWMSAHLTMQEASAVIETLKSLPWRSKPQAQGANNGQ